MLLILFASLAAFTAGFVDAIAGGGGLITIPALLLSGLPPHQALACNKFSSTLGTASAVGSYAAKKLIRFDLAVQGIAFSLLGAALGSVIALHVSPDLLGKILVGLLPFALIVTIIPIDHSKKQPPSIKFWKVAAVCLGIGIYDGFFGPGTGSFLICCFHWLLGLELLKASATAKVLNLASNLASAITFVVHGSVLWSIALPMAIASITGNILGSRFAIHKGNKSVQRFLTFSLFLLTLTLVGKYFLVPNP
ncbi:MAG: TSUP family transporter [Desulfovibrio sp.]|nr:TSUP family transporter [Desulfovibrio sp.]